MSQTTKLVLTNAKVKQVRNITNYHFSESYHRTTERKDGSILVVVKGTKQEVKALVARFKKRAKAQVSTA